MFPRVVDCVCSRYANVFYRHVAIRNVTDTSKLAPEPEHQHGHEHNQERERDISRISAAQRDIIRGKFVPSLLLRNIKSYKQKMYGIYGAASGYDPGVMWPSRDELKKIKEYESSWEPNLDSLLSNLTKQKQEAQNVIDERLANIDECMKKMPRLIKEYEAKQHKKLEEVRARERKHELLLEEARDFFGYAVNPQDEKFQEMVKKKEEEERLAEKQRKKEKRMARLMAKYQSVAARGNTSDKENKDKCQNDQTIHDDEKCDAANAEGNATETELRNNDIRSTADIVK